MSEAADGAQVEGGNVATEGAEQQEQKMVPQSEVDRILKDRIARERDKFKDYDDLKAKAEGSKTLEQRLAELETELTTTRTQALKTSIAARFGVSTEPGPDGGPSDADLFLTGSDESTLTAQAQRLAARETDRKLHGNVAPKEGAVKNSGDTNSEERGFVRNLFGSAN